MVIVFFLRRRRENKKKRERREKKEEEKREKKREERRREKEKPGTCTFSSPSHPHSCSLMTFPNPSSTLLHGLPLLHAFKELWWRPAEGVKRAPERRSSGWASLSHECGTGHCVLLDGLVSRLLLSFTPAAPHSPFAFLAPAAAPKTCARSHSCSLNRSLGGTLPEQGWCSGLDPEAPCAGGPEPTVHPCFSE